jgi:hypothetical protein
LPPTFSLDRRSLAKAVLFLKATIHSAFAKASADDGSTGSKQTLNGLFLFIADFIGFH